ncbi:MAG: sigma-70 family RNA polymerase sigma factor [Acidobacteriota bacterium]
MPEPLLSNHTGEITQLLLRFRQGDAEAANRLLPIVYDALRNQARFQFRNERHNHTLQPTALVHEVFLQLFGNEKIDWHDRLHFFVVASNQMRRLLVDYARAKQAHKREGDRQRVELTETETAMSTPTLNPDVLALDQALELLAADHPRAAQVVELRYFGGMTEKETAEALEISLATVKREWEFARAWLFKRLKSS